MARFLSTPPVPAFGKRNNGKTEYRASAPIRLDRGRVIEEVPTGWRSDGGSFPWWAKLVGLVYLALAVAAHLLGLGLVVTVALGLAGLAAAGWFLTLPDKLIYAYFMHDFACQQTQRYPTKRSADDLLNDAMKALGVSIVHRLPIYGYVRMRSQRVQWQQPEFTPITVGMGIVGWE